MSLKRMRTPAVILVLALVAYQPSLYAAAIPSRMPDGAGAVLVTGEIEKALAAEGLTPQQIESRIAALSAEDLAVLQQSPALIRSAGISMSRRAWIITGIAVTAVALALALYEDDEGDGDDPED